MQDLQNTMLTRQDFPTALEQAQFEIAFTDKIQSLLEYGNAKLMKNLTLNLALGDPQ